MKTFYDTDLTVKNKGYSLLYKERLFEKLIVFVLISCFSKEKFSSSIGSATIPDPSKPAKLCVKFFWCKF
jgi:lipocalin